jgi:hypothetical protein
MTRRYTITSRIQARARFHAMTVAATTGSGQWDAEALAVETIATELIRERFPAEQAQIAAQAAWDNTKSQPPL